jgi:arylsulfatase A-like enzyme
MCGFLSYGQNALADSKKSPNIILIITDDQGWTHTSHRADPKIPESQSDYYETPHIDQLAKSGVMFTQGYAPNPICSPTRHSVMFGQNAARHIYNHDADWYKKTSDWLTLPKVLKQANPDYKAAHFGKWHIAMVPKDAGFDYDDGMTANAGGEIFGEGYLNARDYANAVDNYLDKYKISNPTRAIKAGKPSAYWSDENPKDIFGITTRAKAFMADCLADGKPFFVQLSHYATHLSLVSRKETYEYFKNKPKGQRHTNAEFAAMLKDLDNGIGMIIDFVEDNGIADNTYIFLMGDNGGRLTLNQLAIIDKDRKLVKADYSTQHKRNIPLRAGKHTFYEGGLRVPFIAIGPKIKPGRITETPVTGLDLLPTFAELAGYEKELPRVIDGGSLVPLLHDEGVDNVKRNSEALIFHQGSHRKPRSAIRKGKYKLIKYWSKEPKYGNAPGVELFDLSSDMEEKNNLIDELPVVAETLEKELGAFLEQVDAETGIRDIEGPFNRLLDDLK